VSRHEKELQSLMERTRRSLRSARNILDDGDHDFAMSRAYYAMFYAATAALLSQGITRAKHSGVIAAFGQHLVKPGKMAAEHQRALQVAFRDRSAGDYAGAFPSREEVERRLEEADIFVQAVTNFLKGEGFEGII
jgi:uncharacterized protein (UPF0332 family)